MYMIRTAMQVECYTVQLYTHENYFYEFDKAKIKVITLIEALLCCWAYMSSW